MKAADFEWYTKKDKTILVNQPWKKYLGPPGETAQETGAPILHRKVQLDIQQSIVSHFTVHCGPSPTKRKGVFMAMHHKTHDTLCEKYPSKEIRSWPLRTWKSS